MSLNSRHLSLHGELGPHVAPLSRETSLLSLSSLRKGMRHIHFLKGIGTALLFTLRWWELATQPHLAAQEAGKCTHWLKSHLSLSQAFSTCINVGIAGWISLCCAVCPVIHGMFGSILGFYLLDASHTPTHPDNQKCLQIFPNSFWWRVGGTKLPLIENHCSIKERRDSGGSWPRP